MGERTDLEPRTEPGVLPRSDRALDRTLALWTAPRRFAGFKRFVARHATVDPRDADALEELEATEFGRLRELFDLDEIDLAQLVAVYLGLPFRLCLGHDRFDFELLPRAFCERHLVVPLRQPSGRPRFALGNPFLPTLAHTFETHRVGVEEADFVIVTPQEVRRALNRPLERPQARSSAAGAADHLILDATKPLEPLHRILCLHALPRPAVS